MLCPAASLHRFDGYSLRVDPLALQEEVAAPYIRLLALLVRRNQATIWGERLWRGGVLPCSAVALGFAERLALLVPQEPYRTIFNILGFRSYQPGALAPFFAACHLPHLPLPVTTHARALLSPPADYKHEMKLSLVHLTFLPPHASLALLLAVWPMCRARREAQDYLAMLLGKARFGWVPGPGAWLGRAESGSPGGQVQAGRCRGGAALRHASWHAAARLECTRVLAGVPARLPPPCAALCVAGGATRLHCC
jgi:hypothetical protein